MPPIKFVPRQISVSYADPRILIVDIHLKPFDLIVCVAHAPHTGAESEERRTWWEHLRNMLETFSKGKELVLLIDANARCDHEQWPIVGELVDEKPNRNSEMFYDTLSSLGLFVPSSFVHFQWGDFMTWAHPATGSQSRIDYTCLPVTWNCSQIEAWVDPDINSGRAGVDHTCVVTQIQWTGLGYFCSHKPVFLDTDKMLTQAGRALTKQIVQEAPHFDWGVNATEHAASLTNYFNTRLSEAFPIGQRTKTWSKPSEETSSCLERLTGLKRELRAYKSVHKHSVLRFFFDAWRHRQWTESQVAWSNRVSLEKLRLGRLLRDAARCFTKHLKKDKSTYLRQVAQEAASLSVSEIYRALRPLMPNKKTSGPRGPLPQVRKLDGSLTQGLHEFEDRWTEHLPNKKTSGPRGPLPQVRKLDGSLTQGLHEFEDRWTEHFAVIEAGQVQDVREFIRASLQRQGSQAWPELKSFWDLPTLQNLELGFQKVKPRRAAGPDRLPAELMKAAPAELAALCYPLLLKMVIRNEEPIQWKGGRTVALFKGKGAHDVCANFRSILLMSTLGKAIRASMRSIINAPYVRGSPQGQLGGKPRQSVLFGAQVVRHFISWHKQQQKSCAVLFCDVMSAFYTVLRELAVGCANQTWPEQVDLIIKHFGLGPEVRNTLVQTLEGQHEFRRLGATDMQMSLLRESLSDTWFSFDGKRCVRTTKGSRPGDSWADCTFNILFQAVLQKLMHRLQKLDLVAILTDGSQLDASWPGPDQGAEIPFQVTWADDLAVLLTFRTPQEIVEKLPFAAAALFDTLAEYGMKAAIGPTKTAAIVLARGPGAVQTRRTLFRTQAAGCYVLLEEETILLPFVDRYKHLGGVISATANLQLEMQARCLRSRSAFWRIGTKVLRNKKLPFESRKAIFDATVVSVHAWGSGAWPLLSSREWLVWSTALWDLYAKMVPWLIKDRGLHISRSEILTAGKFMRPEDVLHLSRVRHVGSLLLAAPPLLHAMIKRDQIALHGYQASMQWFWSGLGRDQGIPKPYDWHAWSEFITNQPTTWKSTVKRVGTRYIRGFHRLADVEIWHRRIRHVLRDMGCIDPDIREVTTIHACLVCNKGFASMRAWFCHASQKHGYVSMQGEATKGRICPCCSKQYKSSLSLKHHLAYSGACRSYMWLHKQDPPQPESCQPHPQMPWTYVDISQPNIECPFDRDVAELTANLDYGLKHDLSPVGGEEFVQKMTQTLQGICTVVMPFPSIHAAFASWARSLADSTDLDLLKVLEQVACWLLDRGRQLVSTPSANETIPDEQDRASVQVRPYSGVIPSFRPRVALFLHFFSGHRRMHDLQWWLEKVFEDMNTHIEVASIDVVISESKCDLSSTEQQMKLLSWIRAGSIAGLLVGPPCETWSVAREHAPEMGGPRPIRSRTSPWGLWDIRANESAQVEMGSLLLGFALEAMLEQARKGGFGVLEHPRCPRDFMPNKAHAPSIWDLAVMKWLISTGLFGLLHVEQGHHGASSRKPTTLLLCGTSTESASELERSLRSNVTPCTANIGKCGTEWKTSHLKAYPSAFCRLLALLFKMWWCDRATAPLTEVDAAREWLAVLYSHLSTGQSTFGPDYHRGAHQ